MMYFAAAAPQDVLASGNAVAILALIVVTLAGVIVYLVRKLDKKDVDHAAELKALNAALLQSAVTHAADYREMAKNDQAVLSGNSQAIGLIAGKIESVKGNQ